MGTGGAPSSSSRRKKPSEERKRRKKSAATVKSSKRRRHDSCSSSSGSDHSSLSTSSSDSEGSRARKSKKAVLARRQRRRSPSRVGGSLQRQNKNKKRKRFQGERESKKHDSRGKVNYQKKGHDRRHRRRGRSRSTSVSSPDTYSSRSCSTCRSRSGSPERTKSNRSLRLKGEHLKMGSSARGRSIRRDKDRSGGTASHGRRRSLSRSSCSGYSYDRRSESRSHVRRSASERHSEEVLVAEKDRSSHSNEMEGRYCDDNNKNRTDIILDCHDLHTSQIDDRYDGGWGRDSGVTPLPALQHASERKTSHDSAGGMRRHGHTGREEAGSKEESFSAVVSGHVDGAQWKSRNDSPTPRARLKSQVSTCGDKSDADELELLLRQKALENFKNFRAKLSTNVNSVGEQKYEPIPFKSHEVAAGNVEAADVHESTSSANVPPKLKSYTYVGHRFPAGDGSHPPQFKSMSDANMPVPACRVLVSTEKNKGNLMQKHPSASVNTESVPDSFNSSSDLCPKELEASPCKLQTVQESSGKAFAEEDLSGKNMLAKKTSAKPGNTDTHKKEMDKVNVSPSTDSSCHKSASEFEQKTMSVMHGGEMVQVSYKVYIPKKTPALARRQLQH